METAPSEEAQANMRPNSWGAKETELTETEGGEEGGDKVNMTHQ